MASSCANAEQARAAKQAENQAHRAAKKNKAKTAVVEGTTMVLTHNEKIISDAIKVELEKELAALGDKAADSFARDTKCWMDFANVRYPKFGLAAFAAAEAQRWYEVRHPKPVRPPRKEFDKGR
jgi:hypothetical protein